jgi:hypothetical protein
MACSHPLQRVRNEVARPALRLDPRLLFELADPAGELVADEVLRAFEEVELRLVHRHARDALQLRELFALRRLVVFLQLAEMDLAVCEPLLPAAQLGQLPVDLLLFREHAFLDLDDSGAVLRDLPVDLRPKLDGLFARGDLRLAAERHRLSLRLLEHLFPLEACRAEPRPPERSTGKCHAERSDDQADHYPDGEQHAQLQGSVVHGASPAVRRARAVPRNLCSEPTPRLGKRFATPPLSRAFRCRCGRRGTRVSEVRWLRFGKSRYAGKTVG